MALWPTLGFFALGYAAALVSSGFMWRLVVVRGQDVILAKLDAALAGANDEIRTLRRAGVVAGEHTASVDAMLDHVSRLPEKWRAQQATYSSAAARAAVGLCANELDLYLHAIDERGRAMTN